MGWRNWSCAFVDQEYGIRVLCIFLNGWVDGMPFNHLHFASCWLVAHGFDCVGNMIVFVLHDYYFWEFTVFYVARYHENVVSTSSGFCLMGEVKFTINYVSTFRYFRWIDRYCDISTATGCISSVIAEVLSLNRSDATYMWLPVATYFDLIQCLYLLLDLQQQWPKLA